MMGIPLKPRHLKRYGDLARLLAKHGGSHLFREAEHDLEVPSDVLVDADDGDHPRGDPQELAADLERLGPTFVKQTLLEVGELVESLPSRINSILGAMADNRFKVEVDAVDQERLIASLEHIANRITAGLVLTALILGAALLMRVDTELTVLGYPALAIVLFLAAAGFGFGLVLTIMLGNGSRPREEQEEGGFR